MQGGGGPSKIKGNLKVLLKGNLAGGTVEHLRSFETATLKGTSARDGGTVGGDLRIVAPPLDIE